MALPVLAVGGYLLLTEERVLFDCAACMAEEPRRCVRSGPPAARFEDEASASAAALKSLCATLAPDNVAACVRTAPLRFQVRCSRSVKRVLPLLFQGE